MDRALADPEWLRERLADVEAGQPNEPQAGGGWPCSEQTCTCVGRSARTGQRPVPSSQRS